MIARMRTRTLDFSELSLASSEESGAELLPGIRIHMRERERERERGVATRIKMDIFTILTRFGHLDDFETFVASGTSLNSMCFPPPE